MSLYVVFHPYLPEYDIQGTPEAIRMSDIKKYGWKWAIDKMRKNFLKYDLRPQGRIHESHARMFDLIISRRTVVRRLEPWQVRRMRLNKLRRLVRPRRRMKRRKTPKRT